MRGRFAQVSRAKTIAESVLAYQQFQQTLSDLMLLRMLPFDDAAATAFLWLKATVKQVGTQDLNAAIVLSVNGTLVTRNLRDFGRIPGLRIEDWTQP